MLITRDKTSPRSASISCSHTLMTCHPAATRADVFRASRAMFPSIFGPQYAVFDFGRVPCIGQPCQKQPSTNMASRTRVNTISGRPGSLMATWKRSPEAHKPRRSFISGTVSRERILDMHRLRCPGVITSGKSSSIEAVICFHGRPTSLGRSSHYRAWLCC